MGNKSRQLQYQYPIENQILKLIAISQKRTDLNGLTTNDKFKFYTLNRQAGFAHTHTQLYGRCILGLNILVVEFTLPQCNISTHERQ